MSAPEFASKRLVRADMLVRSDDYSPHSDPQISPFMQGAILSSSAEIRRNKLDSARFDMAVSEVGDMFKQPDYVRFHRRRFFELDGVVQSISESRKCENLLDFGVSTNSYILQRLFPDLAVSVADRPGINVTEKNFRRVFPVDLEDDDIDGRSLGMLYDVIVFSEVIEHLRIHPVKVLRFLLGNLSERGCAVITTPNLFSRSKLGLIKRRISPLQPYPLNYTQAHAPHFHFREYSMGDMLTMVGQAGGKPLSYFYSDCWDDPEDALVIPDHELGNMVIVIEKTTS